MKIGKIFGMLTLIALMCVSQAAPVAAGDDRPWAGAYLEICIPYTDKSNENIYAEYGCSDYYFHLVNIDDDGVPELVVNADGYWIEIYTFDGSQVVLTDYMGYGFHSRYYWCYENTGLIESYVNSQAQDAEGVWWQDRCIEYYVLSGGVIEYMGSESDRYNEEAEYVSTETDLPAGFTPDESGKYIEFSGSDDSAMTVETAVKKLGAYTAATCVPSTQKLMVNGRAVTAEIYNIGGYNYFKLRDLAALASGGVAPFDVGYDSATATISMTSGLYQPIGGELTPGKDNSAGCVLSTQKVHYYAFHDKDRYVQLNMTAYNIGGYNYFKLRDINDITLSFEKLEYDASTNTVLLEVAKAT